MAQDKEIVEKIKKLLRMANNSGASDNEREVALSMAQKLIEQHKVDQAMLGDKPEFVDEELWEGQGDVMLSYNSTLSVAVAEMFGIRTYISYSTRTNSKGKYVMRASLRCCGESDRNSAARVVFEYLVAFMRDSAVKYKFSNQRQRYLFKCGFCTRIYLRVMSDKRELESVAQSSHDGSAIELYNKERNTALDLFMSRLNFKDRKHAKRNDDYSREDRIAYAIGDSEGKRAELAPGATRLEAQARK